LGKRQQEGSLRYTTSRRLTGLSRKSVCLECKERCYPILHGKLSDRAITPPNEAEVETQVTVFNIWEMACFGLLVRRIA
jgi:hypothetical protein